ncbi:MAG: twin-arginine translocation signal domain-containing protein, partial [Gemmatimonadaceae bacterium]
MKRRSFLKQSAVGAIALTAAPALIGLGRRDHSLVLRGGTVIDGSGKPRFAADVAVDGDRIVRVVPRIRERGTREIDCRGLIVAPGFVDIHSHGDGSMFDDPMMESVVRQGVTTIVVGADGSSRAPSGDGEGDGAGTMRALFERINALPPGANVGT